MFVVRQIKNARRVPKKRTADYLFSERYFWRALWKTRTAKPLLACAVENVHGKAPLNRAPEGMRTTIIDFSVVNYQYL
jgi:hypothetical protein